MHTSHGRQPRALRFAALHVPAYRRYFVVNLLSMTADNIEHVISYWVIFQLFRSPTLAGFAVISHWVPFLLFSLHAGALADRYDCRKLIQISQGLFMSASVAWAVLIMTGTLQKPTAQMSAKATQPRRVSACRSRGASARSSRKQRWTSG